MPMKLNPAGVKSHLSKSFRAIGADKDAPLFRLNDEHIAWEYFVSKTLASLAKARHDKAKVEAVAAGVIRDYEKFPDPPHEAEGVYTGDFVKLTLTVKKPVEKIDTKRLRFVLERHLKKEYHSLIDACFAECTTTNRPAHQIDAELLSDGED